MGSRCNINKRDIVGLVYCFVCMAHIPCRMEELSEHADRIMAISFRRAMTDAGKTCISKCKIMQKTAAKCTAMQLRPNNEGFCGSNGKHRKCLKHFIVRLYLVDCEENIFIYLFSSRDGLSVCFKLEKHLNLY